MTLPANANEAVKIMRHVRQVRQYTAQPVPEDVLRHVLDVARWTGSSRNTQPWHFIVVTNRDALRTLSQLRAPINWLADAPLAIAIVLNGKDEVAEAYDEGRVTERILVASAMYGLGGGIAWFGNADQQAEAKRTLGIPGECTARAVVAIGHFITSKDPRPSPAAGGRRPFAEVVSHNQFGEPYDAE